MPQKHQVNQLSHSKPTKSQKLDAMARKKDERAIRAAYKKEKQAQKYLPDDVSVASFSLQLNKLGLQLRNIPGDGNCLFRALGDQLDGHGKGHCKHRRDVVKFMSEHRADFEPFVEDDVPFERHVECLSSPGTYAGNDAIVAFARLHQVTVVIHQLNSPIWEIHGTDKANCKQVHISYHNGDHYSSVRRLGDESELPANIRFVNGTFLQNDKVISQDIKKNKKYPSAALGNDFDHGFDEYCSSEFGDSLLNKDISESELQIIVGDIMHATKCSDKDLITTLLGDNNFDSGLTIALLKQIMSGSSGNSSANQTSSDSDTPSTPTDGMTSVTYMNGTGIPVDGMTSTVYMNGAGCSEVADCLIQKGLLRADGDCNHEASGAIPKSKQRTVRKKRERKQEKKARAEERHRQKFLGLNNDSSKTISSDDDDIHTVINETLKVLQI